jgi:hypothetical protein
VTPPKPVPAEATVATIAPSMGALSVGDRIEYAVTHEINADGEKAWIKYGVNTALMAGENPDDATSRVTQFVNTVVMQAATEVAKQIMQA